MRGIFITFEGVDGSGKSTHAKHLRDRLSELGIDTVLTREPGGAPVAERIREVLLDPDNAMAAQTEALLMAAARAEHVRKTVLPALERGFVVISERFLDSTIAYQVYGRGLDADSLRRINAYATGGLEPDITYLMTAPPADIGQRVAARDPDRIEMEDDAFRARVSEGFMAIAAGEPGRVVVMECKDDIGVVGARILEHALPLVRRMKL